MTKNRIDVSVVVPTYNEVENIKILLPRIEKMFRKKNIRGEIIIVDDSSPDGTAQAAQVLNKKYKNIIVVTKGEKEGIGSALRVGYNKAVGTIILSTDADLSFDVNDMTRLIDRVNEGYDLVVGSRHLHADDYEKKAAGTRVKGLISYFGNIVVRKISGIPIHDFSANFRAIRREVWNAIETQENTNSLLFEMILKTHHCGYWVAEIPVVFTERLYGESKLNLGIEAPKFFMRLMYHVVRLKLT